MTISDSLGQSNEPLRFTSIQAPNQDFIMLAVSQYLGWRLELPVEFVDQIPWQAREQQLYAGQIEIGWICGLPYVVQADTPDPPLALLAAPVMLGTRYADQPQYFSDVVVRRDRHYRTFEDLRGASWAYNEPHSHSGYNLTCYNLACLGETSGFFGQVLEAGSHQAALEMVLSGQVAASAIDSTVLEIELARRPELNDLLRVIEAWGPSPIPPLVTHRSLPAELHSRLQKLLLGMHQEDSGRSLLASLGLRRFAEVSDQDYDPIRRMARRAAQVELGNGH
jgi:phosphonate transport system substrate-binding protein